MALADKVNGFTNTGTEMLSRNLEYITLVTTVDIRPKTNGGAGNSASQLALDTIIQVVSLRAQPIIIGAVSFSSPNYTLRIGIEHAGAWTGTSPALTAAIELAAGATGLAASNTTATFSDTL